MAATRYEERLLLPLTGSDNIKFSTSIGLPVAVGYDRVVIGERGPYIEFDERHIIKDNIHIPPFQAWREKHADCFYIEYRSKDCCNVKLYHQKKLVDYADYKIGKWYISPFDLVSDQFPVLILPLKRKRIGIPA